MTIDIDAIRKREQAATPGPWHPHTTYPHTVWQGSMYDEDPGMISTTLAHEIVADAEFIAHARQDIPALLAELDKVRAQLADTQKRAHTDATNLQQILRDKTALANERDALKRQLADIEKTEPAERAKPNVAPNGCDRCSVEPGERHRYAGCLGNVPAHESDCACWDVRSESCALPKAEVAR